MTFIDMPSADLAGMFRFEAFRADKNGDEIAGSRRVLADWFPNLITDNGLDLIGSASNWLQYCQVGSGSTTPANGDTALASRIAGSSTEQATSNGAQSSSPYFTWRRKTFRFAEGVAAGNLAEVGVGAASTGNLFSRALILDGGGSPTVITVLSDEVLDVSYEIRCYPPTSDWTGTVNISGTNYDMVGRAANVTSTTGSGWSIGPNGELNQISSGLTLVYNGAIGAITSAPTGSSGGASSVSNASYSTGTRRKDATGTWGLNNGNLAGGVSALRVSFGIGTYQIGVTPAIPKDNTKILALTFRNPWARRAL